jgi:hypothetical protein
MAEQQNCGALLKRAPAQNQFPKRGKREKLLQRNHGENFVIPSSLTCRKPRHFAGAFLF